MSLKPEELVVESTGENLTFRHQPGCARPARPCGCFPSMRRKEDGLVREFWVTPHPNRFMRRRAAALKRRRGQAEL